VNSERFSPYYQICHRLRTHLLHDVRPMDLNGNLGKSDFGGDLFVQEAA
jgi:hypothetical protein